MEENWPAFLKTWRPIVQYAADQGVKIGIENCPMFFSKDEWPGGKNLATTPAIWRRMFEAITSDSFGLNYDPSHLLWQQIDYVRPLVEFDDRIVHVHLKDAIVERERLNDVGILATPLEYHTAKLPGRGSIDWRGFLGQLRDIGYEGPACIEAEDRDYEGSLELRKQALRESAAFIRQCLQEIHR